MFRIHEDGTEKPFSRESRWGSIIRINSACLRLARLHTLMAWAIFPAPAIYTIVLYHSTAETISSSYVERVFSCLRLCGALFVCVMSYRAAGLAWDDIIDREFDAQVRRSKSRPLPSGDISLDGALLFVVFQSAVTIILLQLLTSLEVSLAFFVSAALFGIYPYLKRWTHYTQIFGALLISMGALQGWLACATLYDPIQGYTPGWAHAIAILRRDWVKLWPIFLMEFFYELAHELIYGCQDTAEDVLIGLHSLSILCGYENSGNLGTWLVAGFTGLLGYCSWSAGISGWPLSLIPSLWLLKSTYHLDLSVPKSCGSWATFAIKVKFTVTSSLMCLFLLKEVGLRRLIASFC
ncbi:UbiA prenyltransferase family-domain-containing protein [Phakopsora pachyrhizi]|uniref:UbiA prenyltransferase family-domain-containing protein n=1 Tax=Phakopsora pachyrhizi TaxID=170000 RepID=A0AAV0AN32_PHAPC|nr:UbiA prenyltransferase family-domain-containing protein [Phakopsora pachyrhizi]CAH7670140.1 UbiA prenyltransferase family-domain-containing protein [Phakopsora pachyrhizi]